MINASFKSHEFNKSWKILEHIIPQIISMGLATECSFQKKGLMGLAHRKSLMSTNYV